MTDESPAPRSGLSVTLLFLLAITVYFAAQVVLRVTLGGALETDEAEMMVMTPGLQLGYGPQLPLYNWLQIGLFELLGRTLAALSLLKNGLLWLTYLLVFLGLRLWVPAGAAAMGALSLFLVPDIAWEAQRATTHSNMLLATSALTLAAFLWAMRGGAVIAWLTLGLVVGLGGLAKYNFWLVPVGLTLAAMTISGMRAQVLRWRALSAPLIAAAIVAAPYWWMLQNPELAFSSLGKLQLDEATAGGGAPEGLILMSQGLGALLALPLIAALLLFFTRSAPREEGPRPGAAALLVRAGIILAAMAWLGIWLADVGHITPRWLLPLVFMAVPGLFVWLHRRLSARVIGRFSLALTLLAALIMGGLAYDRFKDGARRDVDFTPLPAALEDIAPLSDTPVIAEFYTAGNLARLRPEAQIAPYLPFAARAFAGRTVLFVLREEVPPSLEIGLAQAGWPAGSRMEIIADGTLSLPYRNSENRLPLRYVLAHTPRP